MWRLNFVIAIAFLAACAPRPESPPMPTMEAAQLAFGLGFIIGIIMAIMALSEKE